MTVVQSTPEVEPDSATPGGDATRRAKFDALALQQLLAPVRRATAKAQRIQWIASAATVVPFVGIVELGRVLLSDGPVNTALTITHFADVDLQRSLRRRIVDTLGRLPLGWFNGTSSGEVRKVVQNDVYLFDDTLWENIRVGRPDAGDADIEDAARTAGLMSVVARLPDGWQTQVGEGGSALSGGGRQRVSIARALIKTAPIVLFDEATSALDPENEDHVADSIRRLAHASTVIVVAHKLSTVAAADNIVVLSADGTVQDSGTHADLITRGGQYADFWSQRMSATGWTMVTK
jgi:energy-coupling factor transporter ATP-binding protein EcfA2